MADLRGFDANQVEPSVPYEAIPAGKYLAMITTSEMKANQAGTGRFLELVFAILEGSYSGRKITGRLNLENPSDIASRLARAELSAICRAVGVMAPNDSVELHNLPLVITVRCRKRKDTGEITNDVSGYARKEVAAGKPQQAQESTPPWRRPA
jgi:hypothetical protein